jgi:hypothetical protein
MKPRLRIALAGGAAAIFGGLAMAFHARVAYPSASILFFIAYGTVPISLALIFVIAATPKTSIPIKMVGLLTLSETIFGCLTGLMYASCDENMRSFIPGMILIFWPLEFVQIPLTWIVFVLLGVMTIVTASWIQRRFRLNGGQIATLFITGAALVGPCAYAIATAFGNHPTPGNCVI